MVHGEASGGGWGRAGNRGVICVVSEVGSSKDKRQVQKKKKRAEGVAAAAAATSGDDGVGRGREGRTHARVGVWWWVSVDRVCVCWRALSLRQVQAPVDPGGWKGRGGEV